MTRWSRDPVRDEGGQRFSHEGHVDQFTVPGHVRARPVPVREDVFVGKRSVTTGEDDFLSWSMRYTIGTVAS